MNYIIDKNYLIIVNNTIIERSFRSYVNELCINNLSTLEGRIKATKKLIDIKYNIPIFVSKKILLFKVISESTKYYINYFNIKVIDYNKSKVIIVFKSMERLNLFVRGGYVKKYIKICEEIEKIFNEKI